MFSVLAGRRLASGPPAKAGLARVPASRAPRPPNASAHLASRPSSPRRSRAALASAQPRAVPLLAARARADRGRELPPRGGHVPARSPRGTAGLPHHSTRSPSPALPRRASHSPLHFANRSIAAAAPARSASSATARRASPELACPATTAHGQQLRRASSTASTSRTTCSPW